MKEHQIFFKPEMVRAILEGRKTQTRRVIKPQPIKAKGLTPLNWEKYCPYGQPGDRLWVRETWCYGSHILKEKKIQYKATYEGNHSRLWRASIHMPRWASRITLEIINVRVERLREISENDAKAEGIGGKDTVTVSPLTTKTYRQAFEIYWDNMFSGRWKNKINKKHPWVSNPWVWVVEFKKI